MTPSNLWDYVPAQWQPELKDVHERIDQISHELNACEDVLPEREKIFRALSIAPRDVRVIIVGQDPYPNPDHACGLSFSVPAGTSPLPGSLRNIIAEVKSDIGDCQVGDGNLEPWMKQGVLLLNRTLTVEAHHSDSHKNLGWEVVTSRIIRAVVAANPDVVAVLWGKQAQLLINLFSEGRVVAGVHPSPLSAHRGFLGSKPFSQVNQLLTDVGRAPIQW